MEANGTLLARRLTVAGRVQGVGFRPFVYRTATELRLAGWVRNGAGMVDIHVEGPAGALVQFETALFAEAPPLAKPTLKASTETRVEGFPDFEIRHSEAGAEPDNHLPPDLFCCDDCLAELHDPAERRHAYAFTNCTQCGPRYTIITALPYDRPSTSMAGFDLCPECRAEYENPLDRRFHAQPLACPVCGPRLTFRGKGQERDGDDALNAAVAALRAGNVVAVKGIGGYHLMCDAANDGAVATLRERKHRPDKPLAVLFPQRGEDGLDAVRLALDPSPEQEKALTDPARSIVLARKRAPFPLSGRLAPGLEELGAFLPYSPLHVLLLDAFGGPLVATSGNTSGEPVIIDNREAETRLGQVADAFLHHNRPIVRPADDSVTRVIAGVPRAIRLGRGIAPMEIEIGRAFAKPTLAVGGHLKNTIALGWGNRIVVSPHIGELESARSREVFGQVIADLQALYGVRAARVFCDLHPDYVSTRWAEACGLPLSRVQHHRAHASALAGEHFEVGTWLTFTWDGVGYGDDGTIWGGEAFLGCPGNWQRVASIRPFGVTGGDRVGREPWRSAAGLMWEAGRAFAPQADTSRLVAQAWEKGLGTLATSAAGRLFDAAASLVLGRNLASFEGQGPMEVEAIADPDADAIDLPNVDGQDGVLRLDWEPILDVLIDEGRSASERAGVFHASLAHGLANQALRLAESHPFDAVGLTGGVFQNRLLAEKTIDRLTQAGLKVLMPQMVPANDGGLSFGQLIEALGREND
ncbi:MAG: carbamoyltransferase HypF [Hyphomicrobiaceae bacterium]|nr:carbamoyltransferase HypF [Hyphomicrobiaceae bacterium]